MNLIETGYQKVNAECDPNLGTHGVFSRAKERFDAQVLLDPLEEKFNLPAALVNRGNGKGGKIEVICKKDQPFPRSRIDITDASQPTGIIPLPFFGLKPDSLVAPQAGRFIDRPRFKDIETCVAFGADHEIRTGRLDSEQSGEIQITTIKNVDASGVVVDLVHEVDVVDRTIGDPYEYGDWSGQIDLSVKLDRRFCRSEVRPGKDRQAQVDGGSIDGINHLVEVESVGVPGIQPSCFANENLSECFVSAPVPMLVRVSEVCSSDVATNAHCVAVGATSQTSFDIAKALTERDLRKGHCKELIACGHPFTGSRHRVQRHAAIELLAVNEIGDLGENQASGVHPLLRINREKSASPFKCVTRKFLRFTLRMSSLEIAHLDLTGQQ